MALNIPKGQLAALGKIVQFDQERLTLLLRIFHDAKPSLFIDDAVKGITEKLKTSEKEAKEIARTLYSVYATRVAQAHKMSAEAFLKNICDALEASHVSPTDGDWKRFKAFILDLFGLKGTIEITSKALNVLTAN